MTSTAVVIRDKVSIDVTRAVRAPSLQKHLRRYDLSAGTILAMPLREAKARARAFSGIEFCQLLTSPDGNPKLWKSTAKLGRPTWGLTLLPSDASGEWDTCPWATAGCKAACLATSGRGRFDAVAAGRDWKTRFLGADPVAFFRILWAEIDAAGRKCARESVPSAIRFNVLSDLDLTLISPDTVARAITAGLAPYDYTAQLTGGRHERAAALGYDLSFSVKETTNEERVADAVRTGAINRAVVVFAMRNRRGGDLPATWHGLRVVDGDLHDYRPEDGRGVITGLRAKDVATASFAEGVASGFFKPAVAS
jgi:hypothetical protein